MTIGRLILISCLLVGAVGQPLAVQPNPADSLEHNEGATTEKSGAVIPLSPQQQTEYSQVQSQIADSFGLSIRSNVTLLSKANGERVLVFTDSAIDAGRMTAEGQFFSSAQTGAEYGVLFADDVSIQTTGERVSFKSLERNPSQYAAQVVRVTANFSRASVEIESEAGGYTSYSTGWMTDSRLPKSGGVTAPTRGALSSVLNVSQADSQGYSKFVALGSALREPANGSGFITIGFGEAMWMNGRATVDVLVYPDGDDMVPVTVNTQAIANDSTVLKTVSQAGEVVSVSGDYAGGRLSTKQALLKAARCAPDSVTNPVTGCIPLVSDTAVHSGLLIGDSGYTIPVVGLSNQPMSDVIESETGHYTVHGRVVSAEEMAFNTSSSVVLVAYEMERTSGFLRGQSAKKKARQTASRIQSNIRSSLIEQSEKQPAEWGNQANRAAATTTTTTMDTTETTTQTKVLSTSSSGPTTTARSNQGEASETAVVDEHSPQEWNSDGRSPVTVFLLSFIQPFMGWVYLALGLVLVLASFSIEVLRFIKEKYSKATLTTGSKPAEQLYASSLVLFLGGGLVLQQPVVLFSVAVLVILSVLAVAITAVYNRL